MLSSLQIDQQQQQLGSKWRDTRRPSEMNRRIIIGEEEEAARRSHVVHFISLSLRFRSNNNESLACLPWPVRALAENHLLHKIATLYQRDLEARFNFLNRQN